MREEEVPRVFTSRGDDQRGLREAEGGDESIRYRDSFSHDEARRTACDGDDCSRFKVHYVEQIIAVERLVLHAHRHRGDVGGVESRVRCGNRGERKRHFPVWMNRDLHRSFVTFSIDDNVDDDVVTSRRPALVDVNLHPGDDGCLQHALLLEAHAVAKYFAFENKALPRCRAAAVLPRHDALELKHRHRCRDLQLEHLFDRRRVHLDRDGLDDDCRDGHPQEHTFFLNFGLLDGERVGEPLAAENKRLLRGKPAVVLCLHGRLELTERRGR